MIIFFFYIPPLVRLRSLKLLIDLLKLDNGALLGTGKGIDELELAGAVAAPFVALTALAGVLDADGLAHVVHVDGAGEGGGHLDVGETLADAATGSDTKGAEGRRGEGDVVLGGLAADGGVLAADEPALGDVGVGAGVVVLVVVDGVVGDADDGAGGQGVAVNGHAAGENLAGQDAADRGGQTHGLVDAGAEVGAAAEGGAVDNLLDVVELGANLLGDLLEGVGVADEVEEGGSHGSRGGIGTGNDASDVLAMRLQDNHGK